MYKTSISLNFEMTELMYVSEIFRQEIGYFSQGTLLAGLWLTDKPSEGPLLVWRPSLGLGFSSGLS